MGLVAFIGGLVGSREVSVVAQEGNDETGQHDQTRLNEHQSGKLLTKHHKEDIAGWLHSLAGIDVTVDGPAHAEGVHPRPQHVEGGPGAVHTHGGETRQQQEEVAVVVAADHVTYPDAVVIKLVDAPVVDSAMLRPGWLDDVTRLTTRIAHIHASIIRIRIHISTTVLPGQYARV